MSESADAQAPSVVRQRTVYAVGPLHVGSQPQVDILVVFVCLNLFLNHSCTAYENTGFDSRLVESADEKPRDGEADRHASVALCSPSLCCSRRSCASSFLSPHPPLNLCHCGFCLIAALKWCSRKSPEPSFF